MVVPGLVPDTSREDRGGGVRALILVALAAVVILVGQFGRDLLQPDDTREAEVAREMIVLDDWVVPHLAGLPFVEKPSGFPAVVATAYRIAGGPRVVAARAVAAGFALLSLVGVYLLGRRILGVECGALCVALLATTSRFCRTAHELLLDNALTTACAIGLYFCWTALSAAEPRAKSRAWTACGLSIGVSFVFKGFVGPALFGAGVLAYAAASRRWRDMRDALRPLPVLAFLAPVLTWVVPFVLRATPQEQHEFFIENHFGRAAHAYASFAQPWYFYLADVWKDLAPTALLLPFAAVAAWRRRNDRGDGVGLFLLAFVAGPLALLSLSAAKDSVYFLPATPALAVLVGWWCVRGLRARRPSVRVVTAAALLLTALGAAAMVAVTFDLGGDAGTVVAAFVTLLVAACGAGAWRRADDRAVVVAGVALCAVGWTLWFTGPLAQREIGPRCLRPQAEALLGAARGREIFLYGNGLRDGMRGSMGFYGNRTALEVDDPAELIERLTRDPEVLAVVRGRAARLVPAELVEAAHLRGFDFREVVRVPFARDEFFSLVAAVARTERPESNDHSGK